jgi:hypothetical protein
MEYTIIYILIYHDTKTKGIIYFALGVITGILSFSQLAFRDNDKKGKNGEKTQKIAHPNFTCRSAG